REAKLKKQLESLRKAEVHSDPPLPRVTWGLPFTKQIDHTPIPPHFRELVVDPFNGLPDPCKRSTKLQTLPKNVEGIAMRWFSSLLPHSITSFADLAATFESQFTTNKTRHLETIDLFDIKQKKTETLKQFLTRFHKAMVQVENPDQKNFVKAFQK
ncbi:hypothetical protein CR513_16514, partial [Mucuna pruriens]